jgi:hypothetical protein
MMADYQVRQNLNTRKLLDPSYQPDGAGLSPVPAQKTFEKFVAS